MNVQDQPFQHGALPAGFEALGRFLPQWGDLESEAERYLVRQRMSMAELHDFYAAITPMLEAIFQHLDQFPYGSLPEPEARLLRLALGLAEAAQAVEVIGHPKVPTARTDLVIPIIRVDHR